MNPSLIQLCTKTVRFKADPLATAGGTDIQPRVNVSTIRGSGWVSISFLVLLLAISAFAQGLAPDVKPESKPDKRSAQELFEDANGYLGRRYQEFNKQKLPYDPKLEAQTKKEQKELAVRNAATLQGRSHLTNDDVYYLGMLYHLAGDADAALSTMRLLLKDDPDGAKAQASRNVVVLYAISKELISEQSPLLKPMRGINRRIQTIVIAWSC
jgi:hypothetical protein